MDNNKTTVPTAEILAAAEAKVAEAKAAKDAALKKVPTRSPKAAAEQVRKMRPRITPPISVEDIEQPKAVAAITPRKIKISDVAVPVTARPEIVTVGAQRIQVKPFADYEAVLETIQWVINIVFDDRPYVSAPLLEIVEEVGILRLYTNIDTSEIDLVSFNMEDFYKWFNIIKKAGIDAAVRPVINADQLEFFHRTLHETLSSIVKYHNSAAGLIEQFTSRSTMTNIELEKLSQTLDGEAGDSIRTLLDAYKNLS